MRYRLIRTVLASALCLAIAACDTTAPAGSQRVDPPPLIQSAPSATTSVSTAPILAGEGVLSASDLWVVYRVLLEQYVDPTDHELLIQAAANGLRARLLGYAPYPLYTLPFELRPARSDDPDRDWQGFASGYDAVVQKLPEWSEREHADWIVLDSMLASLDDGHTTFVTPEAVQQRQETSYVGIGVRLSRSESGQGPLVSEVFPDSPAEAAGVRIGDRLVSVDGQSLAGMPLSEVVQLVRGPSGREVELQVRRAGSADLLELRVPRGPVLSAPVALGTVEGAPVGYLRLRSFTQESAAEALGYLGLGGELNLRGWIVDLRGNGGGSLQAVQAVAGAFMDARPIGFEINRARQRSPILASGQPLVAGQPVVVLIDGDTGSGAEILAAALREYDIAQIVGETSSGSVGVAVLIPLPDGSEVQVTQRRYITPQGQEIDRVGVRPDVEIPLTESDIENRRDPQLAQAIALVRWRVGGN